MSSYKGDFPTGKTLYFFFDTFAGSTGAPITMTNFAVGDIKVYKNGSTTERSSTNGYTLLDTDGIDFDTITGIHGFSIDTSDNTDAGFYAAGNDYTVVVSTVTVDSQTMSFIAGSFSIDNRGLLRPTTASRTIDVDASGGVEVGSFQAGAITAAAIATDAIDADALAADAVTEIAAGVGALSIDGSPLTDHIRWISAATHGLSDGYGTGTVTFYELDGTTAALIVTISGNNRTAITRN